MLPGKEQNISALVLLLTSLANIISLVLNSCLLLLLWQRVDVNSFYKGKQSELGFCLMALSTVNYYYFLALNGFQRYFTMVTYQGTLLFTPIRQVCTIKHQFEIHMNHSISFQIILQNSVSYLSSLLKQNSSHARQKP